MVFECGPLLSREVIQVKVLCATDGSWEWLEGPILGAEIYNGKIFDE